MINEQIFPYLLPFANDQYNFFSDFGEIFNGLATLLSVGLALFLFWLKSKNEKRDASRVLLMEIRNAEKSITDIKNTKGISATTFVMPVSSWFKFQHHFVADLDSDELILLNDFYNLCALVQMEIDRFKNQLPLSNEVKIKLTQEKLMELADKYQGNKDEYEKNKKSILLDIFFPESVWFVPSLPELTIRQHIPNIRYITTSSCGEKLKRIAKISS